MSRGSILRSLRAHRVAVCVIVAWLGLVGAVGVMLGSKQASDRAGINARLAQRVETGAEFLSLYVDAIAARERARASVLLAGRHVSEAAFVGLAQDLGFSAAVLVDRDGRLLAVMPSRRELLGSAIARRYPHLARAVAGHVAVSNIVPSAARGVPVIAIAVPYRSADGRRVLSGAFGVANTPVGAYLAHLTVVPGKRVYLLDGTGRLIASDAASARSNGAALRATNHRLAASLGRHTSGSYDSHAGAMHYVEDAVAGTPWHVVVAVPAAALYASIDGASSWLVWLAYASLGLAGVIITILVDHLIRGRERLAEFNRELVSVARADPLTGLHNRRSIEETLHATIGAAQRRGETFAVLLIDVDHFKKVNDTLGHLAGDAVLLAAAKAMRAALRPEDTLGRWGGEEFIAVLPNVDAAGAVSVAERLRARAAGPLTRGEEIATPSVTVTVGAAVWSSGSVEDLINSADAALYAGKRAGRDNVQLLDAGDEVAGYAATSR